MQYIQWLYFISFAKLYKDNNIVPEGDRLSCYCTYRITLPVDRSKHVVTKYKNLKD